MNDANPSEMIGDLDALVALAATARLIGVTPEYGERHYVLQFGLGPSAEHVRRVAAMRAEMERARLNSPAPGPAADAVLCRFQTSGQARYRYTIGTNIYGWACGCTLRANLAGGRWAQTPRGATFLEAVQYGARMAENDAADFVLSLVPGKLPAAVCARLAQAAGADNADVLWILGTEARAQARTNAIYEATQRRQRFANALQRRLVAAGLAHEDGMLAKPIVGSEQISIHLTGAFCKLTVRESGTRVSVVPAVRNAMDPRFQVLDVGGPITVGGVARAVWEASREA